MNQFQQELIREKARQNNITNLEVHGFMPAIRGMRNPLNSWGKIDSYESNGLFILGENDLDLGLRLVKAGSEHCKFLRFINVYFDVEFPLYIWKEFDTYKFSEKNSCSTMHKITSRPLVRDDFASVGWNIYKQSMMNYINDLIKKYKKEQDAKEKYLIFMEIIEMLPSSFLQKRTVVTNYAELRNMYKQRKNHKLMEWRAFCNWIETLPHSELITEGLK